jgi:hypothetical protein
MRQVGVRLGLTRQAVAGIGHRNNIKFTGGVGPPPSTLKPKVEEPQPQKKQSTMVVGPKAASLAPKLLITPEAVERHRARIKQRRGPTCMYHKCTRPTELNKPYCSVHKLVCV